MDRRKLLIAALAAGMSGHSQPTFASGKPAKTKPPKNRDRVKAARKQNRKRK